MRTPFRLDRFPDIDTSTLQDPANVANAVRFVLTQPEVWRIRYRSAPVPA